MNENGITVILTGYRRPDNLKEQLAAIRYQTVQPEEIYFFQDAATPSVKFDSSLLEGVNHITVSKNIGVWGRFAVGFWAKTKYVCVFDDDTIPGARWLENCMSTIQTHRGLLGTIGIIANANDDYLHYHTRIGWANPNKEVMEVDLVGHSWFLERNWLAVFCQDSDDYWQTAKVGEDIHFSHMLQKYLGLKTYVPPHPPDNYSMFGSLPEFANELGIDGKGVSVLNEDLMNQYMKKARERGFRLLNEDYDFFKTENGWERSPKSSFDKQKDQVLKSLNIQSIKKRKRTLISLVKDILRPFYRFFFNSKS